MLFGSLLSFSRTGCPEIRSGEPLQSSDIPQVRAIFLIMRGFEDKRFRPQRGVAQNAAEPGFTDLPLSNVGMPVKSRSACGFRVIGVDDPNVLPAEIAINFRDKFLQTSCRREVEAARE